MRIRGFGMLALVLLFASLFAITAFDVGDDLLRLLRSNNSSYLQRKANFAAYAALQRSLSELDKTTTYDGDGAIYYSSWNPGESLTHVPMPGEQDVFYTVRAFNNSQGQLGNPFVHPDGTSVPGGAVYLKISTLARPTGNQRGRSYSADVASLSFVGQVHWQHLLLGAHRVLLNNGARVDAFDSRESPGYPNGPATRSEQPLATVASNGQKQSVQLLNGSEVKGKVRWGPGSSAEKALVRDADVRVSGDLRANDSLYRIPRYRPPYHPDLAVSDVRLEPASVRTLEPGAYRSLTVEAGAILRLKSAPYRGLNGQAPRYYFDQSVVVSGGKIELVGDAAEEANSRVEVYVGDSFTVNRAGQVNPWIDPTRSRSARLQIIFVGNGSSQSPQKLVLDQQSSLWAVVAGRGMSCTIDRASHIYGAIRAHEISLDHQSQAHWDVAIGLDSRMRGLVAWTLQGVFSENQQGQIEGLITGGAQSGSPGSSDPPPPGSDPSMGGGL